MLKKFWYVIRSLFRKWKPKAMRHDMSCDNETSHSSKSFSDVERESDVSHVVDNLSTTFDWRLKQLTTGIRAYRRYQPGIRLLKVDGFADAYRFWLRLCGNQTFSCRCCAGHIRYSAVISGTRVNMELVEKTGRNGTVAILRIGNNPYELLVQEIKFIVTNKIKNKKNDNY